MRPPIPGSAIMGDNESVDFGDDDDSPAPEASLEWVCMLRSGVPGPPIRLLEACPDLEAGSKRRSNRGRNRQRVHDRLYSTKTCESSLFVGETHAVVAAAVVLAILVINRRTAIHIQSFQSSYPSPFSFSVFRPPEVTARCPGQPGSSLPRLTRLIAQGE